MIVLKIIGWVLLSIIGLIVLALSIRFSFRIEYSNENTSVLMKWLFIEKKLYPMEKKAKKEKPEKEEEKEEKKEEKEDKEESPAKKEKQGDSLIKTFYNAEGIDGIITILKKVMSYTKTFFGSSMRAFIIDELYLDIRCTRSDAASTAIYYGEVCSAVFPLLGALASKCRMKKYDVQVYPDFIARFSDASFAAVFHFTPIRLIGVTTAYVFKLLFGVLIGVLVKIFGASKNKDGSRNDNKNNNIEKSVVK